MTVLKIKKRISFITRLDVSIKMEKAYPFKSFSVEHAWVQFITVQMFYSIEFLLIRFCSQCPPERIPLFALHLTPKPV